MLILVYYGTNFGVLWYQFWCITVPILVYYGTNFGVLRCQFWCITVPILVYYGTNFGVLWCQFWCIMVPILVFHLALIPWVKALIYLSLPRSTTMRKYQGSWPLVNQSVKEKKDSDFKPASTPHKIEFRTRPIYGRGKYIISIKDYIFKIQMMCQRWWEYLC